jgi:hypothetical protein
LSEQTTAVLIRPGYVKYVDLCQWTGVSREEFFGEANLKTLTIFGLILETEDLIKVLYVDDDSDNEECEGLVIPESCIVEICYHDEQAPLTQKDHN